jgi:hypothetical protein
VSRAGVLLVSCVGTQVAEYAWRQRLAATVSPRPYLHPVRTFGGTVVTELSPGDHPHHLGVSVAIPDVAGRNFWGGRTFVRHQGPVWLANHGRQRHTAWLSTAPDGFVELLRWTGPDGTDVLHERRAVAARPVDDRAWLLDLSTTLTNPTETTLMIRSPATNGRPGAGYGGFFWRLPVVSRDLVVRTAVAEGERAVHGSRAGWLALSGVAPDGRPWSLVFVATGRAHPWFVRIGSYPGVGAALAWRRPVPVPAGQAVAQRVLTVVADGVLPVSGLAALARAVRDGAPRDGSGGE